MTEDNTTTQADPRTPMPKPALARLEAFVGEWKTEASVGGQIIGRGRAVFEWREGKAFLGQRTDVEQPAFPTATAMIGGDDSTETYCMLYFDSRAVARIYQMSLGDGAWKLWREAPGFSQRFTGTFGGDGRSITGRWEKSGDGVTWEHDFDLTYSKVK